jgi:hypothetical protein
VGEHGSTAAIEVMHLVSASGSQSIKLDLRLVSAGADTGSMDVERAPTLNGLGGPAQFTTVMTDINAER